MASHRTQGQQGQRSVAGETLISHADRTVIGQNQRTDPGILQIVPADGLARLLGEHTALSDNGQVETLGNAGIDFNASLRRLERLQIFHRGAEATAQSARLKRHKSIPGRLQRRDQLAVADHRAKLRHALLGRAQAHFGFSRGAEQRVSQGRRRLADIHLQNRLCQTWIPNRQALQQLHAAE